MFVLFVRLRISQRRTKIGTWNFACVFDYYPDRCSPIWEVKGQGHQGQKRGYTRRVGHIIYRHLRRGSVGSRIWGRRRRVRPYGGICVLQACWRTCCCLQVASVIIRLYHHRLFVSACLLTVSLNVGCASLRSLAHPTNLRRHPPWS